MASAADTATEDDSSLERRLADVEIPRAHLLPAPRTVHRLRALYHHPVPHRLIPDKTAIALARVGAGAEWRVVATRRAAALERAKLLLGPDARHEELRSFARRSMADTGIRREIEWRPWTAGSMRIDGLEHLERFRSAGRGAILASLHLGPFMSLPLALAYAGFRPYVSGGAPLHAQPVDASTAKLNVDFESAGGRWVRVGGSFSVISALLRRGELCHLMLDTPVGRIPTVLAGRPVLLAGGVARLALATGVPIIPGYSIHERGRPVGALLAPIEVEPDDDEAALITRLAEQLDPPLRRHLTQWRPPLGALAATRQLA